MRIYDTTRTAARGVRAMPDSLPSKSFIFYRCIITINAPTDREETRANFFASGANRVLAMLDTMTVFKNRKYRAFTSKLYSNF